jgi:hypothetical protein
MQQNRKPKEKVGENLELKGEMENMRTEIAFVSTSLKMMQIEGNRILETLAMKSYGEEFRE